MDNWGEIWTICGASMDNIWGNFKNMWGIFNNKRGHFNK